MTITAERLRELLLYDPETGLFVRRTGRKAGTLIGNRTINGYIHIYVASRHYTAHRLAWLYMRGVWPVNKIDHRNCVRDDNRLANLREAEHDFQNNANSKKYRNNTSGFKGVSFFKSVGRYAAEISKNNKRTFLGYFDDPAVAHVAYLKAASELFGDFARAE